MKAPRVPLVVLGILALSAPFLLVARAASGLVAPLTSATVTTLLGITAPLAAGAATQPEPEPEPEPDTGIVGEAPSFSDGSVDAVTALPAQPVAKAPPRAKPAALFVSQATVLELARSAARPRGSFVAQSAQHPAGLRLSGVAALGIGLQDGDVLVEALGIAPRAPGEIVGAIIEARAKRARFLSGTVWRHGQTFAITVEQPYLPERSPT